jgi:hypothetical protein
MPDLGAHRALGRRRGTGSALTRGCGGLAVVLCLAGCNGREWQQTWLSSDQGTRHATARTSRAARPPAPSTEPAPVVAARPEEPATATGGDASPDQLIGLDEARLALLLGPPTEQSARAPGKAWVYKRGGCTLDLSLYPDIQTRVYRTLSYEVSSDDNSDRGKRLCLSQLQSSARTKRAAEGEDQGGVRR